MKKLLIIFALLYTSVYAQETEIYTFGKSSLGFNFGINAAKLVNGEDKMKFDFLPLVGVNYSRYVHDKVQLRLGALFSMKGTKEIETNVNLRNNYIDIHLTPQYEVTEGLRLEVGVQYCYLISAYKYNLTSESFFPAAEDKIDGYTSEVEFIYGFEFDLSNKLALSIRHTLPTNRPDFHHLQIALNYMLIKGYN